VQKDVSGKLQNITMLRGIAYEEIVISRQELILKVDEPAPEEAEEGADEKEGEEDKESG
jgi:hypothetical protein